MDFETKARERRLLDVARGKQYLRQIDSLAEKHWTRLEPRNSKLVSVGPLKEYTFVLNSSVQHDNSVTNGSLSKRRIHSEETPKPHGRVPTERVQSERLVRQTTILPIARTNLFNKWGSNVDPMAEKLALKKEDILQTTFEPFSIGYGNRTVQKPSPKKGILMSRVSSDGKDRQIKTNTDFRSSRNGMVAIIHPVGPNPDPEVPPATINQEMIDREQTTMMLTRIDRMLHPNRFALKTKLASSEEEVSHRTTQALSDNSKSGKKNLNGVQPILPRTPEHPSKLLSHYVYAPKTYPKPSKTFAQILEELNKNQVNVDRKCRQWINKWAFDSYE